MDTISRTRLFDWSEAFHHPVTRWITLSLAIILALTPILIAILSRRRNVDTHLAVELWLRYKTWLVLIPMMLLPILAGAFWTMIAVMLLSLGCYFELAKNTSIKSERSLHLVAIAGIFSLWFAAVDHWWELFSATVPVTACLIAAVAILPDQPRGYLQRIAIASTAFLLFGGGLGHLSYMANEANYRPILLLVLVCVEINDVFAFLCGKLFGRRKLAPNTSPGKTLGGGLGALALTTILFILVGRFVFIEPLHSIHHLVIMGIMVSLLGQLGDLTLSAIKRDLGIKDMGSLLPGHGGLLDRFDSLVLVAPAIFYYIGLFQGLGLDQPLRIFSHHLVR